MSNNSTLEKTIEFGEKASVMPAETCYYSTSAYIDEILLFNSFSRRSGTYEIVDYSDEKKMEAYRKINKMLGGK